MPSKRFREAGAAQFEVSLFRSATEISLELMEAAAPDAKTPCFVSL